MANSWKNLPASCSSLILVFLVLSASPVAASSTNAVGIALLKDGDTPHFNEMTELLKKELAILVGEEMTLSFKEGAEQTAGFDTERAAAILDRALNDPGDDIVYAGGSPALAAGREEVNVAMEDRNLTRSFLFPQLQGKTQYSEVDADYAASTLGMQPFWPGRRMNRKMLQTLPLNKEHV